MEDRLVRLEIPARPAFVGVARSVVTTVAGTVEGIDDGRLEDLRIAVSEACTNAVEAELGRPAGTDQVVVLTCSVDEERLVVRIEDRGPGFDPGLLPERPDLGQPDHLDNERGWGISLIRALVDDVAFDRSESGTAVSLSMRRLAEVG